jgi:hypothetical protein
MSSPVKTNRRSTPSQPSRSAWVFAPPTTEDLIRLLGAWRLWILGGLIGAVLGAGMYAVAPPPFRARATVNVDFHLEQAWPQNTDREQFYYLERETRKLVEVALSDEILGVVTHDVPAITLQQLRAGAARMSQPGNGGWHFYGVDRDPARAALIASSWASAFSDAVAQRVRMGEFGGLEEFITADVTQAESLKPERSITMGMYMLAAAFSVLSLAALAMLLMHPRR